MTHSNEDPISPGEMVADEPPSREALLQQIRALEARVAAYEEAEADLVAAKEKAEEMARLKSVFLANMSHEIRTPLTSIIGFAEVLASELPEAYREFAHLIGKSGKRLMETLNSVLDLAQLESRSMKLNLQRLDPVEVIQEALIMLEPMAFEKGLELCLHAPSEPVTAELDVSCLNRIIVNLVTNAIKFTDHGRVTIEVAVEPDVVVLRVRDTGIGIDPDFVPHLFDEFRQESSGMSRSHEGSGLGLYITRCLVQMMDGSIAAESIKGEGSMFTVTLPRHVEPLEDTAEPGPPQLLVVEDNPETCRLLEHVLGERFALYVTDQVDEALQVAREHAFDIALLDINLGQNQSGVDLCRLLRTDPAVPALRIVAMTAYALPGDRKRLLAEGFDDYLGKPFTKPQLLDLLDRQLA